MLKIFLTLVLTFLLSHIAFGGIVDRVIYSGNTPLFSDCRVVQTGPMQLTVPPCTFTTTGRAKIISALEALPAQVGVGRLAKAISENEAEWLPDGLRVRVWIKDEQGDVITRSLTYRLPVANTINIIAGNVYVILLTKAGGITMTAVLTTSWDPNAVDYVHILATEFEVPLGTTDLSNVRIPIFTVKQGQRPLKKWFEQ